MTKSDCELSAEQEYLDKLAEIFNRENPDHSYTHAEVDSFDCNVANFMGLTYRPIPKDKLGLFESLK